MKTCSKCKTRRSFDLFAFDPKNKDRLSSQCKICERADAKEHHQKHLKRDLETKKRYREKNRDKIKLARIKWNKANPNYRKEWRARNPLKGQAAYLRLTFGMTVEQYNSMLAAQKGVCALCKKECCTGQRLAVDHCHKTGVIRGLLCRTCNTGIGMLDDSPEMCEAAAMYLRKISAPRAENQQTNKNQTESI